MTFDNWPWTVRHAYDSGAFAGVSIQSTKEQTFEQVLAMQREGKLGKLALIDPEGVFVAQQAAMDDVRGANRERLMKADLWYLDTSVCECPTIRACDRTCEVELNFEGDRLVRIVHSAYSGPRK
ncbi:MAG TPA: hypothetical protein VK624_01650 [Steroidobacteraceae bacterium]|nr:hypothetical protein [Steroidobacteraceae bacterium]